jgi:hypothetical protein
MEVQDWAGDNHPVEALKTFIMFCVVGLMVSLMSRECYRGRELSRNQRVTPCLVPSDYGRWLMPLELIDRSGATGAAIGLVTCPNCQIAMRRFVIKLVKGESELREAAYRCPRCDAETKRWVKL